MSKFNAGDKVRPYRTYAEILGLEYDRIYTVAKIDGNRIALEGRKLEWFGEKAFELIKAADSKSEQKLTAFEYGLDPFYENRDDLMEWLADEDVIVSQVAAWVVTHPSEKRDSDYVSHAPVWIIKIEDLPRIFDKIRSMERDNLQEDES